MKNNVILKSKCYNCSVSLHTPNLYNPTGFDNQIAFLQNLLHKYSSAFQVANVYSSKKINKMYTVQRTAYTKSAIQ